MSLQENTFKTWKKNLYMRIHPKDNEIFSNKEKHSGFNLIKPYFDLFKNTLFFDSLACSEGALFRTHELLVEYLSALEKLDLTLPHYDLHISFRIELMKNERLDLFGNKTQGWIFTFSENCRYISITLTRLMLLFLDLSEKLSLTPDANYYKTLIRYERLYIETGFNLTKNNESSPNLYDTLCAHFEKIQEKFVRNKNMRVIFREIAARNSELHLLFTKFEEQSKKVVK